MRWIKKGLIFKVHNNYEWMVTHTSVPIADKINQEELRIYFGPRDKQNRSYVAFIDVNINNPKEILYIHDKPVLSPGDSGCFDDCGAMPGCIVNHRNKKYLYYIGWNVSTTVPYRNSIGLAVSNDKGYSFKKLFKGPLVDRTAMEPYFTATPFVMLENNLWRMWYLSATGWVKVHNNLEPLYNIRYAESKNGVYWIRKNIICIDYKFENEAISRPCVIKEKGLYKMWYSYRGSIDFRTNKETSYRIGYAESKDGIKWIRKDDKAGIDLSESGWDSLMIEYPFVYEHENKKYLIYCGNGFGKSGFGYAILETK